MEWFQTPEFNSPAEPLAWDEAFLERAESGEGGEALWFWESPSLAVVLGYGQQAAVEADLESCAHHGVPVLRRCSGGGAVLQGPGCWNYGLVLRIPESGPLASITGANEWIMERNRHLLQELLDQPVTVEGHTDLAVQGRKCSGNAQRRKRHHLLFHGTLLHDFPLSLIPRFLRFPSAQPGYRQSRDHLAFVRNVPVTPQRLCERWIRGWGAEPAQSPFPIERTQAALSARYEDPEWHSRR
jgi:lipoate-protein ligase A